MKYYKPPNASLDNTETLPPPVQPLRVAVTSAFWGASIIAVLAGLAVLIATYPNYELVGFTVFLIAWLVSVFISMVVTVSYGLIVHALAIRTNLPQRISYLIGGLAPGTALFVYGSMAGLKEPISIGVVVSIYGVIIANIGVRKLMRGAENIGRKT